MVKIADLNQSVGDFLRGEASGDPPRQVPGLSIYENPAPTEIEPCFYQPVVCLTLQGAKEVFLGSKRMLFRPGRSIIVSHDLPVASRIIEASQERPYRSLLLTLDLALLRSLYEQLGDVSLEDDEDGDVIAVDLADPAFVDAFGRYFALFGDPAEASVMAPLIQKELHFRMLRASHGGMLRRLLRVDSRASRIGLAIAYIRENFRKPIAIADLAKTAGMSASSFHAHFRAITETTPLQYQKDLRLIEAKRLLSEHGLTVSAAAFDVGYESPTQFSREFSRKFGASPRDHLLAGEARRTG